MGSWHSPGLEFGQIWGVLWIFVFGMDMFWGIYIYTLLLGSFLGSPSLWFIFISSSIGIFFLWDYLFFFFSLSISLSIFTTVFWYHKQNVFHIYTLHSFTMARTQSFFLLALSLLILQVTGLVCSGKSNGPT